MTEDETHEFSILSIKSVETQKFAVSIGFRFPEEEQRAFERLMLRDWIRLIDVCVLAIAPGVLMRIFRVMPEAVAWHAARTERTDYVPTTTPPGGSDAQL